MCLMHKGDKYGMIILADDDLIYDDVLKNFTEKLSKHMPWKVEIIEKSLQDLIKKNVIKLQKNSLIQGRMVKDNKLSETRAKAGKKGGIATKISYGKRESKTKAKHTANTEYEIDIDIEDINTNKDKGVIGGKEVDEIINYLNIKAGTNYKTTTKKTKEIIKARMNEGFKVDDFKTVIDKKCDEWIGREMEKYLRPETLFSNKFEGYLNQKIVKENKQNNAESLKYMQREDTNYDELITNRYQEYQKDKPIELTAEQAAERDKVRKIFAMDIKKLAEEKKIDGG